MKLLRYVPVPALIGAGLFLFWLLSRWDGAQTARLAELDRQQATLTTQTLHASKTRRATKAQSEATDRENALLRAAVAAGQASIARLRRLGDSAGAALVPVLSALPDSVSHPVIRLLSLKDSTIALQAAQIDDLTRGLGRMEEDRNRWREQDGRDAQLATQWEQQAGQWRKEAKKDGCRKLLGIVPLPDIGAGGAAVYASGGVHVGPALTASVRFACFIP